MFVCRTINVMKINIRRLVVSIGLSLSAGFIGSVFTYQAIPTWYESLKKPDFIPPNSVFGPVWTTLYILMGIALYLVWCSKAKKQLKHAGYLLFGFQLLLNTLWSIVFFGLEFPLGALAVILILWGGIVATLLQFYKISKVAGYLLIPYLLWVSFATFLNYSIVQLN